MKTAKEYLGDGVYVDVIDKEHPGALKLTTEDGLNVTNTIFLEDAVIERLIDYYKRVRELSTLG